MQKKSKQERKYFRKEGVVVRFPGQAQPVLVERLPLLELSSMPAIAGGFQPFRPVVNLKVKLTDQPDKTVNVFDPPIIVRIRYTSSDLEYAAKIGKPLNLGFWDGKQWVRCTPAEHGFHLTPSKSGKYAGWGTVSIATWDDPIKAWGT